MNACQKGKAGEREAAHYINDMFPGLDMRRGAQHAGNADAPDINGFPGVHWEVKRAEKLNIHSAMAQAVRDCEGKNIPVVMHRRNRGKWMMTIEADNLIAFARAVILANEACLASNAGQEAGEAVERVESKPRANRKTVAIEDCWTCTHSMVMDETMHCRLLSGPYGGRIVIKGMWCDGWTPCYSFSAIHAPPATQEGQSSGKSVSGYGSDGEGLESRNVKPRKGWTAEDIERDIQSFKELDAMDADRQTMPADKVGEQEKMP